MIAEVIVEIATSCLDKVFDYKLPNSFFVENLIGRRVLVPFGPRKIEGYIIAIKEKSNLEEEKLKEIYKFLDNEPVILPEMFTLMEKMTI